MKLYDMFASKMNQTQMVKNACRWTSPAVGKREVLSFQANRAACYEPVSAGVDTDTRIESAIRREPSCLNDIFSELIADNAAMGMSAA